MAHPLITVVIPAHNPPRHHLDLVLAALRAQTLSIQHWELVLVDDGSKEALANSVDLSWHSRGRSVATAPAGQGIGLVGARLKGFASATGSVVVFVDQDNVLAPDYLQKVVEIAETHPLLGAWGGQILLRFDDPKLAPDPWLRHFLCTRELERDIWSNDIQHHASTPWGAGLCVRREVLALYRDRIQANPRRAELDPTPKRMGFGGDTDIVYTGCRAGYGKGVFQKLKMDHWMPVGRCADSYFLKVAEAKGYSEVLHVFLDEGVVRGPRNDWRFWFGAYARRSRMKRLEWELLHRTRRGQQAAVRDLANTPGSGGSHQSPPESAPGNQLK